MLLNLALATPRSELIIESTGLGNFSILLYQATKFIWIVFLVTVTMKSIMKFMNCSEDNYLPFPLRIFLYGFSFILLLLLYLFLEFVCEWGRGFSIHLLTQFKPYTIPLLIFITLGLAASLQDLRTQRVNVLLLYFFFQISWYLRCEDGALSVLFMAACLVILFFLTPFRIFEQKKFGTADIIFMLSVALQFPLKALPFFLFSSGAFGVFTYFLFKRQSPFPFFPALFISWGLTTLLYRGLP